MFPGDRLQLWLLSKDSERKVCRVTWGVSSLPRSEQDRFLMAQLKAMNGGEITASRRLKKKTRIHKRTFYLYYWDRDTYSANLKFGIFSVISDIWHSDRLRSKFNNNYLFNIWIANLRKENMNGFTKTPKKIRNNRWLKIESNIYNVYDWCVWNSHII